MADRTRVVAELLAQRMAVHAFCEDHPETRPERGCPFCEDRAAYAAWLASGGRDYRSRAGGPSISLTELRRLHEEEARDRG
jgi:hypothetical protein